MGRCDTARPWKRPGTHATKDHAVACATAQYLGPSDHSGSAPRLRYASALSTYVDAGQVRTPHPLEQAEPFQKARQHKP